MKIYIYRYIIDPISKHLSNKIVARIKIRVKRSPVVKAMITREDLAEMFLDWKKQKPDEVDSSGAVDFLHYVYEELNLVRVDKDEQEDTKVV